MLAFLYDWDWPRAEQELVRAITLKPQYSFAYIWHSFLMSTLGRHEESIRSITRAQTLDPLSLPVNMMIPRCYYWGRRFDEALRHAQAMLEMESRYQLVYLWLGKIYLAQGRLAEALAILERGRELTGPSPYLLSIVGMVYGKLGHRAEALAILQQLREAGRQRWVSPFFESHVLIGLGERDGALRLLEDAYQQRSGFIVMLPVDPLYDEIRSDPRFQHLLQSVRLDSH
jgi:tetratricopeptide (TPR) repeat protein